MLLAALAVGCDGGREADPLSTQEIATEGDQNPSGQTPTPVERTLERLLNVNHHRDHVMIVAHRGLWSYNGEQLHPEQSRESIQVAISAGIEGIELDVRATQDGQFVVLHDGTLDRTTTCEGAIQDLNWSEVRNCQLVIVQADGRRVVSHETILTLEEAYTLAKDYLLINLDNKIGTDNFPAMFQLAIEYQVDHQILASVTMNTWSERRDGYALVEQWKDSRIKFMPNIYDSAFDFQPTPLGIRDDYAVLEDILQTVNPVVVQVRKQWSDPDNPSTDGGYFFTEQALQLRDDYNTHYWMNTLYADPPGYRSGGRGDEKAVAEGLPDDVWGWWYRMGATMIQTDEPELARDYLLGAGYRQTARALPLNGPTD